MQVSDTKGIFIYRPSPVLDRSWMIYRKTQTGDLSPVGDYTVLDRDEQETVSEKKIINLISVLNDNEDMIMLGEHTKSRMMFHRKPKLDALDPDQVVFYTYNGDGVSRENAILTLEAGVVEHGN